MTEKVSLTELQLIIRDSLYVSLPDFYWVTAEISELKENSAGHCYIELIEKNPDEKNVRARVRAIVWSNRYRFIKAFFENSTNETLREGLKILVKTKVEYHELYGLSLIISDIDPAFTIGDMAMKRQLIIKRLEEEGVFSMNKELEIPLVPQRIAVISSKNAAGYTDFIRQLKGNAFGYVFYTALIETSMQGNDTESGVIYALDQIALNYQLFDLVVIIRGGGSQSDLSWFDSYNIAYHVTQFPLPVLTGIGHDKDISVTDLVANKSLKTPTAVADFLINSVSESENYIIEMSTSIIEASRKIIERYKNRIETSSVKIHPLARIMLTAVKENLSAKTIEINNKGKNLIYKASLIPSALQSKLISASTSVLSVEKREMVMYNQNLKTMAFSVLTSASIRMKGMESNLQLLNPENVLLRGYTITSLNGKIIKGKNKIKAEDIIDTQFIDGSVRSRVIGEKKSEENSLNTDDLV
jgi:exodeoxyribonuclease VII large subunit